MILDTFQYKNLKFQVQKHSLMYKKYINIKFPTNNNDYLSFIEYHIIYTKKIFSF